MYSIKYSNQAEVDLEEAISHIAKESATNAINYLSGYENKIELLQHNPYIGVGCKNKLIRRDCRLLVFESHIIIYRLDKSINEVFIIRIYHGSVDYANKLNEESKIDYDFMKLQSSSMQSTWDNDEDNISNLKSGG